VYNLFGVGFKPSIIAGSLDGPKIAVGPSPERIHDAMNEGNFRRPRSYVRHIWTPGEQAQVSMSVAEIGRSRPER